MTSNKTIQIETGATHYTENNGVKLFVGFLKEESLENLKIGSYQREEVISEAYLLNLKNAILNDILPPIELGMRGTDYKIQDSILYINSDVYIIDGLQRVSAYKEVLKEKLKSNLTIQCVIYVDSKESWERERFESVNTNYTKLSDVVVYANFK